MVIVFIIVTLIGVSAIPSNWFEAADVTGIIVQTETGIVKAIINLGSLQSASEFNACANGTITVVEASGVNITKLVMNWPGPTDEHGYFEERFFSLTINLTIYDDVWSIPIVTNGAFETSKWSYAGYQFYDQYADWTGYHLPQGTHPIMFTVYGKTQIVSENVTISITFLLELSA